MEIFEDLSLEFTEGWSCIVGANGSGKSTLLKLITRELKAQGGTIKGNSLSYYCAQSTENMPDNLEEFMLTYTSKAFKIRDLLNIEDAWTYAWETLSHGERKRLQLALALFVEADVLLIDEPTNHLDNKSKDIVIQALKSFKGIGILVSHDRELLDTLSRSTIILKNQEIRIFKTSYTNAINEYYKNLEHLQNDKLKQNTELKKLKKSIQNQHEKISQSKKRMSKKTLKSGDSDAKGKIDMARFTGKDKNDGTLVAKLQAKEKKITDNNIHTQKTYQTGITVKAQRNRNIFPLVVKANVLKISEEKTLSFPILSINEHEKIAIVGENGAGKSSFIEHLLSTYDLEGECLYIPQEINEEKSKKIFDAINDLPREIKGEIYTIIQRLSSDSKKLQDSFAPSPGS
ncbi:MAG: ATP-binding cassette domain-containing protein [Sulfurimonas sp.]|nr:ATP-binding cassette domain-containing protein [Sulfurimonas sp.]